MVVFFEWHFIDLFCCIAASLFNKLTYLTYLRENHVHVAPIVHSSTASRSVHPFLHDHNRCVLKQPSRQIDHAVYLCNDRPHPVTSPCCTPKIQTRLTTWIPQTVYCYFWAYLFLLFSFSVFTLFSCRFRAPQIRLCWPLCAFRNYIYLLTYLD